MPRTSPLQEPSRPKDLTAPQLALLIMKLGLRLETAAATSALITNYATHANASAVIKTSRLATGLRRPAATAVVLTRRFLARARRTISKGESTSKLKRLSVTYSVTWSTDAYPHLFMTVSN